ncbi:hypothetical protein FDECE_12586 [Fusarium decemcellulare]|nr:hypothetical protein FDECE_12586 [Fusarium decemcellulare]
MESIPTEIWANVCSFLAINDEEDEKENCICIDVDSQSSNGSSDGSDEGSDDDDESDDEHQEECEDYRAYLDVTESFSKKRPDNLTPNTDICNFRLVCKRFSWIGAAFTHKNLSFRLQDKDVATLKEISQSTSLARHVRGLRWYGTDVATSPKFDEQVYYDDFPSEEDHPYSVYSDLYDQQLRLGQDNKDLDFFKGLFSQLGRLQHIDLLLGGRLRGWQQGKGLEADHLQRFTSAHNFQKLDTILEAAASAGLTLESFGAGVFYWKFFDREPQYLERLFSPLHHLRRLELVAATENGDHDAEMRALFETGILKSLLEPLTELRSLVVQLPQMHDEETIVAPARLSDIIIPDRKLPHLKRLSLHGFECTAEELLSLLRLHKDTLRELCLGRARITTSYWETVVAVIRDELDLERACLCGNLFQAKPVDGRDAPAGALWLHRLTINEDEEFNADEQGARWRMIIGTDNYCCRRDDFNAYPIGDNSIECLS